MERIRRSRDTPFKRDPRLAITRKEERRRGPRSETAHANERMIEKTERSWVGERRGRRNRQRRRGKTESNGGHKDRHGWRILAGKGGLGKRAVSTTRSVDSLDEIPFSPSCVPPLSLSLLSSFPASNFLFLVSSPLSFLFDSSIFGYSTLHFYRESLSTSLFDDLFLRSRNQVSQFFRPK